VSCRLQAVGQLTSGEKHFIIGGTAVLQASSSTVQPVVGVSQPRAIVRRERPRGIEARASRRLDSHGIVVSRDTGKDWWVVQQAISGNPDAQEHLFGRSADQLYRAAYSVLRNKEDAEDAVQEALCKAHTSLASFQGRSSFSTWLTRIVINTALMARRRKCAHPESSLDEILDSRPERLSLGVADPRPTPEKVCAMNEDSTLIEKHVRQLPSLLRTAFRLSATYGLTIPESSDALGIRVSAYKTRLSRARQKLTHGLRQSLAPALRRDKSKRLEQEGQKPSRPSHFVLSVFGPATRSRSER
jgi:RNA polymerase sigma-70 factor (ECF subfamily)